MKTKVLKKTLSKINLMNLHIRDIIGRDILKNNILVPFLQPVFDADSKVCGVEVLLRCKVREHYYPLGDAILYIESSKNIDMITCWLINAVKDRFMNLQDLIDGHFYFSFNLLASQINSQDVRDAICEFQKNFRSNIGINIEIVERDFTTLRENTIQNIIEMKSGRVKFSIDDFGTGSSSIKYIEQGLFDIIKLDKSLTIEKDGFLEFIKTISSVSALSDELGVKTLAEGVENTRQLELLKGVGVSFFQGYFMAKPMSMGDFIFKYLLCNR